MPIEIRREELSSPAATKLIAALDAELTRRYPEEGANHFRLDAEEIVAGRGAFLVLYEAARPVGCGALRRLDAETAEIKRMYVEPRARGKGFGRAILQALEAEARGLGVKFIVLETGERQHEAVALYTEAGFVPVPVFGEYLGSPLSRCMRKTL